MRLNHRWASLATRLSLRASGERTAEHLLTCYAEPHRRYHTIGHLAHMLRELDDAKIAPPREAAIAELVAWFHDAVYDPMARDNELQSAALAEVALTEHQLPAADIQRVAKLILLTREHVPSSDPLAAVILDADLAVLGRPSDEYRAYVKQTREEYAAIDDAAWRTGRRAFLLSFMRRERLFASPRAQSLYEQQARMNLVAELETLIA